MDEPDELHRNRTGAAPRLTESPARQRSYEGRHIDAARTIEAAVFGSNDGGLESCRDVCQGCPCQASALWIDAAFVQLLNAGLTLWLMFSESIGLFVVLRSVVSIGLTGAAIALSATWFVRSMRRHGVLPSRVPAAVAQGCS